MTATREQVWESAVLDRVTSDQAEALQEVLAATDAEESRGTFERWMARYAEAEMTRPADAIIGSHEFGGHLRPLFARNHVRPSDAFRSHGLKLFQARRAWSREHQFHGYHRGDEVHHEPETFLYFQIPLLDLTGDPEVLEAVEDVAAMTGNWAEGVPDWYDWETHGFRSTHLGSQEVHAAYPDDYQEANHWRMISIALAAHRHGAGHGRYLDLAKDYAGRWCMHVERCAAAGDTIRMQILPEGAEAREMGCASDAKPDSSTNVYPVFYSLVASNTAFDVVQGLQDVYRLSGDERSLDAAGLVIDQFRVHADPVSGRWATTFTGGSWSLGLSWDPALPPIGQVGGLLAQLVLRQEALRPDPGRRRDFLRWAEAVLAGGEPLDAGAGTLLFTAFMLSGEERFRTEGYRRVTCGLAACFDTDDYHCCGSSTRPGYGAQLIMPWLAEAGLAENGTRGSWPLAL